ncbi:MAG: peptidyl-prolyl cis-trans isomerase SurA, partial [Candidatus Endobugula sp.]
MSIYKKAKSLTANLASISLLTFVSLTSLSTHANQNIDSIIAIVKDDIIFAQELKQKVQQAKIRLTARNQKSNEKKLNDQLLDTLILEKLQLSIAKQNNLSATDAEIDSRINQTKEQLTRNGISFQNYLSSQNLS